MSSDSTTIGVPSCGSVGLLRKCLLKTQGFIGALVSGCGCHDDWRVEERPGGTGGNSREALQPSSLGTCGQSGSACFEAQHDPQLLSLPSQQSSAGCIGDMGPCIDTLVPDQSIRRHRLLAPTHPLKTSGRCHHMGSRWASSGVSIWPSSLHTTKRRYYRPKEHKEKSRTNNMQSVSMRVQDVAGPYVGSQKSAMSQTRHRRADHATLAETKKQRKKNPIVKVQETAIVADTCSFQQSRH